MVTYQRQTVDTPNPIARFAHRARVRRSLSLAEQYLPPSGTVVDFGAGTGSFLSALGDRHPDAALYAIEPHMAQSADPRIQYVKGFEELTIKADLITAFEVCEHLYDDELESFLRHCRQGLHEGGTLLVSVPIVIGGAVLLKELNGMFLFRRRMAYSLAELVSASLGGRVERPGDRKTTHKGFDFRWLRQELQRHFAIQSEMLCPLPLPWWANSQIFFVCQSMQSR